MKLYPRNQQTKPRSQGNLEKDLFMGQKHLNGFLTFHLQTWLAGSFLSLIPPLSWWDAPRATVPALQPAERGSCVPHRRYLAGQAGAMAVVDADVAFPWVVTSVFSVVVAAAPAAAVAVAALRLWGRRRWTSWYLPIWMLWNMNSLQSYGMVSSFTVWTAKSELSASL